MHEKSITGVSKNIKGEEWKHFLVITEMLLQGYPVEDIPLIEKITGRSIAHVIQWQKYAQLWANNIIVVDDFCR